MNQQVLVWSSVWTPIAGRIGVIAGSPDANRVTAADSARLEAVIRAEFATLPLDIEKLELRVNPLEGRAGLTCRA